MAEQSQHLKGAGQDNTLGEQVWKIKADKTTKGANPCLWMQAGVVKFKGCNNYYDCTSCKYDMGMQKQVEIERSLLGLDISVHDRDHMATVLRRLRRNPDVLRVHRVI